MHNYELTYVVRQLHTVNISSETPLEKEDLDLLGRELINQVDDILDVEKLSCIASSNNGADPFVQEFKEECEKDTPVPGYVKSNHLKGFITKEEHAAEFWQRVEDAVFFLAHDDTGNNRRFDDCFENHDGDMVLFAISNKIAVGQTSDVMADFEKVFPKWKDNYNKYLYLVNETLVELEAWRQYVKGVSDANAR